MRKFKFEEYYRKNFVPFLIQRALFKKGKTIRRKPRNPEEWKAIFILSKARWERYEREGKIRKEGRRKYRVSL